mmetsp:Transcript_80027/g.177608  ORF Transcript_80027/g.177608 Transcript_80027/m.177608 type:complete len:241 (+) Transcript_80027:280-1002(+)
MTPPAVAEIRRWGLRKGNAEGIELPDKDRAEDVGEVIRVDVPGDEVPGQTDIVRVLLELVGCGNNNLRALCAPLHKVFASAHKILDPLRQAPLFGAQSEAAEARAAAGPGCLPRRLGSVPERQCNGIESHRCSCAPLSPLGSLSLEDLPEPRPQLLGCWERRLHCHIAVAHDNHHLAAGLEMAPQPHPVCTVQCAASRARYIDDIATTLHPLRLCNLTSLHVHLREPEATTPGVHATTVL